MKTRGFTLLEVIIYLTLFSLLMTGILQTVFVVLETTATYQKKIAVIAESTFLNRKFTWVLAGATEVNVVSSTTVVITRPDLGSDSPLTLTADGGGWLLKRGSAEADSLTSVELVISEVDITMVTGASGERPSLLILYLVDKTPFLFQTVLQYE